MFNGLFFDDKTMNINRSRKRDAVQNDPCKKHVCDLQKCLNVQNFQEERCKHCFSHLGFCCQKFGDKSFVCSGMKHLIPEENVVVKDNLMKGSQESQTESSSTTSKNYYGLF
uniref:Uncharacterized protein n=1 Tax=Cacopsylla melanoneura TaxID=428564 RepID=A0A8D8ZIA9_9HEMI